MLLCIWKMLYKLSANCRLYKFGELSIDCYCVGGLSDNRSHTPETWWPFYFTSLFSRVPSFSCSWRRRRRERQLTWLTEVWHKTSVKTRALAQRPALVLREVFLFTHQGWVCSLLVCKGCAREREWVTERVREWKQEEDKKNEEIEDN